MKKFLIFMIFTITVCSSAFAGGPLIAPKLEEVNVEKPKMVAVDLAFDDFIKISKHWTVGIGLGGNPLIGIVEKDGFGYPKCEYGITCVAGYGYTWVSGQPTEKQLKEALESIRSRYGAFVDEKRIPSLVREETGITALNYFEFGTVALILPLNVEIGTMRILNDNVRTRLGFGLPTLISFGINFDF